MQITKKKYLVEYVSFLLVALFLLARPIGDMDEIWNYNFGYNICNGLLLYSDFNCIVTPLSAYISALFLSVFGNSLFAFRITGILLLATTVILLSIGATEVKVTDKYKICELNRFEGLVIEKELEKQLESVGRFIREKENAGVDVLMADS